jgi:hypothetical protein
MSKILRMAKFLGIPEGGERGPDDPPAGRVALLCYGGSMTIVGDGSPPAGVVNDSGPPVRIGAFVWVAPNLGHAEDPKVPPWRIVAADC